MGSTATRQQPGRESAGGPARVAAFARMPVLAIAGAVGLILLLTSGRYGYFGDELYFLVAGHQHLTWSYVDNPAMLPVLALIMDTLVPGSVVALRIPVTLMTAAAVVIAALTARELGGGRRAQTMAAAAYALSPFMVWQGHLLATNAVDAFFWTTIVWLLVRWVRCRDDRLLLLLGVVTALALQAKLLILVFWLAVGISALAVGPRELLRRPLLWAGGAIAVASMVPGMLWQAGHGWPVTRMPGMVSGQVMTEWGGRAAFLPSVLIGAGLLFGAVLLCYGTWRLMRSPRLRQFRFLGWAMLGAAVFFLVVGGRFYYLAGFFALCWSCAGLELERGQPARWWRWATTWPVAVLSSVCVLWMLPVLPMSVVAANPGLTQPFAREEMGWPQYTASVAETFHGLTAAQRRDAVILTDTYWRASALERFGSAHDLPPVYSGNRGYWYFGRPPETSRAVLYVGENPGLLRDNFSRVRKVSEVDLGIGVRNGQQGMPLWLCEGRHGSWREMWPRLFEMQGG